MNIKLLDLNLRNFAGVDSLYLNFDGKDADIDGRNATGKTTVFNAVLYLFFGKNVSGEERFAIRTLDRDGNKIHNTDIVVSATLMCDSNTVELKKTVREKWIKKRGTETAQFQGNEVVYEIDGYPRKESEYKAYINEMMPEEVFKMITNPAYFASLPWKKQREMLMQFVADVTDYQLACEFGGYDELLKDLMSAPSLDAIDKKYKAAARELADKQKELPIRIDELNSRLVPDNSKHLKEDRARLKSLVENIENLKAKRENIKRDAMNGILQRSQEITSEISEIERRINSEFAKSTKCSARIATCIANKATMAATINVEKPQLDTFKAMVFDEEKYNKMTCPTCGQEYPKEQKDEILRAEREKFEKYKAAGIAKSEETISRCQKACDELDEEIKALKAQQKDADDNGAALTEQVGKLRKELDELIRTEFTPDKKEIIAEIDQAIADAGDLDSIEDRISGIDRQLTIIEGNTFIEERIASLRSELKTIAQKVADNEKMIYLLGKFTQAKMEMVSRAVNEHFVNVDFKLFEEQVNGGIKETCEMTVGGVPYSDLNASDKILAGLRVIEALQKLYGSTAFVFIDNAESINRDRIPKMINQMILLNVTDDPVLTLRRK